MKRRKNASQGDLFGISEVENIKAEIQSLDQGIAKEMKAGKFDAAKKLTTEQERLIQKLVELGDGSTEV